MILFLFHSACSSYGKQGPWCRSTTKNSMPSNKKILSPKERKKALAQLSSSRSHSRYQQNSEANLLQWNEEAEQDKTKKSRER